MVRIVLDRFPENAEIQILSGHALGLAAIEDNPLVGGIVGHKVLGTTTADDQGSATFEFPIPPALAKSMVAGRWRSQL